MGAVQRHSPNTKFPGQPLPSQSRRSLPEPRSQRPITVPAEAPCRCRDRLFALRDGACGCCGWSSSMVPSQQHPQRSDGSEPRGFGHGV